MKNANGFGAVYKVKGNRRKPWRVRVTKGWNNEGKQLFTNLGYYKTRAEGLKALIEYNENPYNAEVKYMTFKELYEEYTNIKFQKISQSNINGYKLAFKYAGKLHDVYFKDIKTKHLQKVIDECKLSYGSKRKIKVLFNQLYKYALQNDIATKDYSQYIELHKKDHKTTKVPFSIEEINRLFKYVDSIDYIDTILIMIYSGMRIGELLTLKNEDIDLEKRTMKGGIKTESGIDRIIPINKKIIGLIKKRMKSENKYLIVNSKGDMMKYDNYYREKFQPIMKQLGMKHTPHECRHTFATLMSNSDANEVSIRKIIGHSSYTTTEKFYTHKDIEELVKAIDKI